MKGTIMVKTDVEKVAGQFSAWRSTHTKRSPLPMHLWSEAVKLAQRDGINATAKALKVDRPSLKNWMAMFQGDAKTYVRNRSINGNTIDVPATGKISCLVEIQSSDGKMSLSVEAIGSTELVALLRALEPPAGSIVIRSVSVT